jgi:hypothetical protein
MNTLQYFGTDTRTAGHYFWQFDATGQYMQRSNTYFKDLPFNPEAYPAKINKWDSESKGTIQFDYVDGWTIFAISGSPIDSRGGCHSVFFINKELTQDQIIQKIKMTPAALKIINQMPFDVKHFEKTQP